MDGYYVEVWRLMLRYPELLAWEMLWTDSLRETYAAIYKQVKEAKPSLGVGWHIWHTNSFNPIYRAEQELAAIAPVSDFLKIVIYHNCGGERMAEYIESVHQTSMGMCRSRSCWTFITGCWITRKRAWPRSRLQDYPRTTLPRDKARPRRPRRDQDPVVAGHRHRHSDSSKSQQVHTGRDQGRSGGGVSRRADGVILSRKYSEMKLANLKGARLALQQLALT